MQLLDEPLVRGQLASGLEPDLDVEQPSLGAVVEVALDTKPFALCCRDAARPRGAQLLDQMRPCSSNMKDTAARHFVISPSWIAASWISTATGCPSRSTDVTLRSPRSTGNSTELPSASNVGPARMITNRERQQRVAEHVPKQQLDAGRRDRASAHFGYALSLADYLHLDLRPPCTPRSHRVHQLFTRTG